MLTNEKLNELRSKLGKEYMIVHVKSWNESVEQYLLFEQENKQLKQALAFYANEKNYRNAETAAYSDVASDEGETARRALQSDKHTAQSKTK